MTLLGTVKKIIADGYERRIYVDFEESQIGGLWCYYVETEGYIEQNEESKIFRIGDKLGINLSIVWVLEYTTVDYYINESLKQPIKESTHVEVVATVIEAIDEYTIKCCINEFKEIIIDFEKKTKPLSIGERIKLDGNLKAEVV